MDALFSSLLYMHQRGMDTVIHNGVAKLNPATLSKYFSILGLEDMKLLLLLLNSVSELWK